MTMNAFRKRQLFNFIICLIIYSIAVIGYTAWSNNAFKSASIHEIDQKLLLAAKSLKFLLAPDFHDRAVDAESISIDEEMKNRRVVSSLAFDTDLEWLYTLVEKDNKFYFAAPTVTEDEAKKRKRWYFLSYEDIPESFVKAYKNKITTFSEYKDQWGHFRSVAIPETTPGGRTYLACADYKISYLENILQKNRSLSIATALYFLICSLPFLYFLNSNYRSYTVKLKSINAELENHKQHLAELVQERTLALENSNKQLQLEIKDKIKAEKQRENLIAELQEALSEVKTLSGLLPICSHCKKIRDDHGYWNRIETYIQNRTDAQFSHGLCPKCAEKLYPEIINHDK